jgi:hypothetical protein
MATDPDLEWTATILDVMPQVILHDRLMTDAALGTVPIKSEHSYSLTSDGDSIPDSPLSLDNKMDGEYDFTELARERSTADQWQRNTAYRYNSHDNTG